MDTFINIIAVAGIVDALKDDPKTKALKRAVKKVKKGEFIPGYITTAGNGKLVSATIFEHCEFTAQLDGVVLAQFGKELPFKNVDELIEAERTALAIYHYRQSFRHYNCSAGE